MQKVSSVLLLLVVFFAAQATAPNTPMKAKIDGCDFELKSGKYTAHTGGESNTTVLTFTGADVKDKDGKLHPQTINVEYALANGKPIIMGVTFEFNDQTFYSLPGETFMNVSKLEWSKDKKSLLLTANFDCKVQKPQSGDMYEGIIGIQGNIEKVKVDASPSDVAEIPTEE